MKNQFKILLACVVLLTAAQPCFSQQNKTAAAVLEKIEPYSMEVTYDKTSHLIFPAPIVYVDLGSEYLMASKAQDARNVLRVKAAIRDFEPETNFSVITDEGSFYSFNVHYSSSPQTVSYDLKTIQNTKNKPGTNDALFEALGNISPSRAGIIMKCIYNNGKRTVKHLRHNSFGITFTLKGLYIDKGKYFFHTQVLNRTNVPFNIDFVNFRIVDKKTARRTALQQRELQPLSVYKAQDVIEGNSSDQNVFLLDQFTLEDNKILLIEIFEKNGGRHQTLRVKNSDLVKTGLISSLQPQ
ncbi:conjugative transposon protein TraN [Flavobacterium sp. LHD-85]|uniref:conjugative transposon protein TraN n=1 Tax=Flavobacterium sp. LHD-85 TaxID=3071410 RepID=UPI0027E079BA|nr:conjugative transposon protein TraN [Flavobacterium sp. LHD-85]MDQ6532159.1 conjugative transposon protein TraN [Flavobacterium sp. LHD-85]